MERRLLAVNGHWVSAPTPSAVRCLPAIGLRFALIGGLPMKIYLAGRDVFRLDVEAWAESARELCRRREFEPLLPIDHGETAPEKIFQASLDMIRKAQIVVANLDPVRGSERDSGAAFELGYALALGKKICGYVTHLDIVAKRVEIAEGRYSPRSS